MALPLSSSAQCAGEVDRHKATRRWGPPPKRLTVNLRLVFSYFATREVILGLDPRIFPSLKNPAVAMKKDPRVKPEDDSMWNAQFFSTSLESDSKPHAPAPES